MLPWNKNNGEIKMEEEKFTCADCMHMGSAVYCMQCVRIGNGYKDMFMNNEPSPDIVAYYRKKFEHLKGANQTAKR